LIEPYYYCGSNMKCWIEWLDRWQPLAAGSLALLGAWITVRAIKHQILQADKHSKEDVNQKLNRLKARANYVSRDLILIAEAFVAVLYEYRQNNNSKQVMVSAHEQSNFSDFSKLSERTKDAVIEICDLLAYESTFNSCLLKKLVSKIQIHQSRLDRILQEYRPNSCRVFTDHEFDTEIIAWLAIKNVSENLLKYARGLDHGITGPNKTRMRSLLSFDFNTGPELISDDKFSEDFLKRELSDWEFRFR